MLVTISIVSCIAVGCVIVLLIGLCVSYWVKTVFLQDKLVDCKDELEFAKNRYKQERKRSMREMERAQEWRKLAVLGKKPAVSKRLIQDEYDQNDSGKCEDLWS